MNTAARRLGMTGSRYTDASGLDSSTVSTTADQVRFGMAAMHRAAWSQAGGRKTLIVAATLGQPGTAGTILPNALRADHNLVPALDRVLAPRRAVRFAS